MAGLEDITAEDLVAFYGALRVMILRAGGRVEITQEEAMASAAFQIAASPGRDGTTLVIETVPSNEEH